jgi:hypothetical protein
MSDSIASNTNGSLPIRITQISGLLEVRYVLYLFDIHFYTASGFHQISYKKTVFGCCDDR